MSELVDGLNKTWFQGLVLGVKESEKWVVFSRPNWIVKYHISLNWANKED